MAQWSLLTNHARVLLCIARDREIRLRDVADCTGLTERAAHRIVSELCEAGYVTKRRNGARNVYELHTEAQLRDPLAGEPQIGELLSVLQEEPA